MKAGIGCSAANLIATIGVVACFALQGSQSFIFAPLAGAKGSYFLALLGLFLFVASVAALSFLNKARSAALGAILYATFFTWLWWHFIRKGKFNQSDFAWIELPALIFPVCICIRSGGSWRERSRRYGGDSMDYCSK
jgi:hypothetical protein